MFLGYETPQLKIRGGATRGLELKIFVYKPNDPRYQPSILAKWLRPSSKKGVQPAVIFKEYVARDMFEPGVGRFKPEVAATLELLKMSTSAYEQAVNTPVKT